MTDAQAKKAALYDQAEVAYTPVSTLVGQACAGCRWFNSYVQPDGYGPRCNLVQDWPQPIQPTGWCENYEAAPIYEPQPLEVEVVAISPDAIEVLVASAEVNKNDAKSVVFVSSDKPSLIERLKAALLPKPTATVNQLTSFKVVGNQWVAAYSNNFYDREDEVFPVKAIDEFVDRIDAGLVPMPELWVWHAGESVKVGSAETVARHGHFVLAAGTWDDTWKAQAARKFYTKHAKDTSLSHGFTYNPKTFKDGVYHDFNTFEISLLPRGVEANRYTTLDGVKSMTISAEKRAYFEKIWGDKTDEVLSDLEAAGKALEDVGAEFKDFGHVKRDTPTTGTDDKVMAELVADLIGGQGELSNALVSAGQALKAEKAAREADKVQYAKDIQSLRDQLAPIAAAYGERPKSASESKDTELTAERIAAITQAAKEQATTKHPFWGTTVSQEDN